MTLDEEYEGWEPGELEEMLAAEQEFREEHDLEDPRDWDEYVDEVGREWLRSQDLQPLSREQKMQAHVAPDGQRPRQSGRTYVPRESRGPHQNLTPIEAPFYDALRETGLTFSTQPYIEAPGGSYRLDFLILYDGRGVAVELDGHDYHSSKEQRGQDAARDRWLLSRGIRVVRFTGSQVYADVQGCIRELLDVVRESQARP